MQIRVWNEIYVKCCTHLRASVWEFCRVKKRNYAIQNVTICLTLGENVSHEPHPDNKTMQTFQAASALWEFKIKKDHFLFMIH